MGKMKEMAIELGLVEDGDIDWPTLEPTAEDWVIARLIMVAARDYPRVGLNYDFMRSLLYLCKRVGLNNMSAMLKAIHKEKVMK